MSVTTYCLFNTLAIQYFSFQIPIMWKAHLHSSGWESGQRCRLWTWGRSWESTASHYSCRIKCVNTEDWPPICLKSSMEGRRLELTKQRKDLNQANTYLGQEREEEGERFQSMCWVVSCPLVPAFQGEAGVVKMSLKRQEGERSCVVRPSSFTRQWRAVHGL